MNTRPSTTSPAPRSRAARVAAPALRTATLHPSAGLAVVDPCHLGRPVNLLPLFTAALREDLAEVFRGGMNRRYRASFEVGDVSIDCAGTPEHGGRWWSFASSVGRIEFALDRSLLLAALHYRYGARTSPADASSPTSPEAEEGDAPARETATEERLAAMLGLQLANALVARVDAWLGDRADPPALAVGVACAPPPAGTWTVRVSLAEGGLGVAGRLWFALDAAWMERLLRHLIVARPKARDLSGGKPLAARLQLQMCGRLLHKEMPLGRLIDLRVGDVIPVSMGATDVLVDDSRLFRAIVAERSGKLCLTSFEDVE